MSGYPYQVPPALLDLIDNRKRFWLFTHEHPDNDGFGSMLATGLALEQLGKEVAMVYDGSGPANFRFLPGYERTKPMEMLAFEPDAALLFDCHSLDRIGAAAHRLPISVTLAVIDHHPVLDGACSANVPWLEPTAAATATLVLSLLHEMPGALLDRDKATCLYAALLTDTGGFRFGNTTSDTFLAASDLVSHGADPAWIAETFLHGRRPEALRLMARVIEAAEYRLGGRVAMTTVSRELLRQTGTEMTETEGLVNLFTGAEGVRLVALLREEGDDYWRISLRANAPHRVDRIAQAFGGGGHMRAAAFSAKGDPRGIEQELLRHFGHELEREEPPA